MASPAPAPAHAPAPAPVVSLLEHGTRLRVSSTLDKSVAKKHLVDGSPETCWSSQQGLPQFIHITFPAPVTPTTLTLTFQGGFVGNEILPQVLSAGTTEWKDGRKLYAEDNNRRQRFELGMGGGDQSSGPLRDVDGPISHLRLVFTTSSDFFGRITIYHLGLEGRVA